MDSVKRKFLPNPRNTANILSIIFFWWTIPIIRKNHVSAGNGDEHVFELRHQDRAEVLCQRLEKYRSPIRFNWMGINGKFFVDCIETNRCINIVWFVRSSKRADIWLSKQRLCTQSFLVSVLCKHNSLADFFFIFGKHFSVSPVQQRHEWFYYWHSTTEPIRIWHATKLWCLRLWWRHSLPLERWC